MEKVYLNENKFNKSKKKVLTVGITVLVIGLIIVGAGIFKVIKSNNMEVPNMNSDNWYESKTSKMQTKSSGMFMIIPGIFVTSVGAMIILSTKQREILAYQAQATMPILKEGIDELSDVTADSAVKVSKKIAPIYGTIAKEIKKGLKDDTIYCKHCGAIIDSDSTFCKNCGKEQ